MNPNRANIVANFFLAVTIGLIAYGMVAIWGGLRLTPLPWVMIMMTATFLVGGAFACLFVRFPAKSNVALVATVLIASFFAGTAILHLAGRDLIEIVDWKIVREMANPPPAADIAIPAPAADISQFDAELPIDTRTQQEVVKDLQAAGFTINPFLNPHMLMAPIEMKLLPPFYPLSSTSNKVGPPNSVTPNCTEGKPHDWPLLRKDRYGFSNDDTLYSHKNLFLLVGSSFAQGSCVRQEETIQGVLTRSGYPTMTTGIGGSGAIGALAALTEYGKYFKPKVIFWQFYDPNDITILPNRELHSSFLMNYLQDGFSQNLIHRQAEVDAFWEKGEWGPAMEDFDTQTTPKHPEARVEWEKRLDVNLPLAQKLIGADISSLRDDADVLKIYEKIFAIAKRRAAAWDGRIYLVMIPNEDIYTQNAIPKYRRAVEDIMARLDIATIDIDQGIRQAGNPGQFFADPKGWSHFNAAGYLLMSRQIMARLNQDLHAPQEPRDGAQR
jgi:hypothetical protein